MYFVMFILSLILVVVVSIIFLMVSYKKVMDTETYSSYECGFNTISYTRMMFSFRFFLISVLFLIFDVEIALMLPIPYLSYNSDISYVFLFFLLCLVLGLVYEYHYGSLNWLNFISKA